MYKAFLALDASVVEINPLVVTGAGEVIALDAKMNFDDNALFRHKDVAEMRDEDEEDPMELEAARHELNYIKLDGQVGCMVNRSEERRVGKECVSTCRPRGTP